MQALKQSAPLQKKTIRIEPSKVVKRRKLEAWALEKQKYNAEVEQEERDQIQKKKDALKQQVAQGKVRAKIKTSSHQQELEAESGEDVDSEEEEEEETPHPPVATPVAGPALIYRLVTFLKAVGPGKSVDSAAILRATGLDVENDAALADVLAANPRINVKSLTPLKITYRPPYGVSSAAKLRALLMVRLPAGDLRTEDGRTATALHEKELADCYPGVETDLHLLVAKGHVKTAIDTRMSDKYLLFFNAAGIVHKPHRVASEAVVSAPAKPTQVKERVGKMTSAAEGNVADLF
jgi:hypothetical protein